MPNTIQPEDAIELPPVAPPNERAHPADVARPSRTASPYFQYATSNLVIVIVLSMLMSDSAGLTGMLVTDPTNLAAKDAISGLSGSSSILMNRFVIMGLGGIKKQTQDLHDEFDRLDPEACALAEMNLGEADKGKNFAGWGIFISKIAILTNLISAITNLIANHSDEPISAQPILLILAFTMNCLANFVGFSAFNMLGPRNANILTSKHEADRTVDLAAIASLKKKMKQLETENNSLKAQISQNPNTMPFAVGTTLRPATPLLTADDEAGADSITQPLLGPDEHKLASTEAATHEPTGT